MSKMIQHKECSSKVVAREMAASWQPLSILMEQLRSSLGAGKKQARVWLGLSQSEASGLPVRSKRTPCATVCRLCDDGDDGSEFVGTNDDT